ncbi:recombinase family protein [Brevibacterium sp. SIMBA_078]|uniref:recombinase family protein n=1 Tax=Brevibacterium sp. SIMBA_078 TaxID=3085816 RepID=UPI00397D9CB4
MTETALSYGRASRDPKHRGTSVDTQLKANVDWADRNGVSITHTLRDDNRSASASRKRDREKFDEALELVSSRKVDFLLVWEMSRALRDLSDYVLLRQACIDSGVHLVYKGRRYDLSRSDDQFTTGLDALMAEREAGDIRDRNLRTVRDNAEKRRPHGRLPYGYRRIYDSATGSLIEQTPYDESGELLPAARVLAEVVRDILGGKSLRRVCMGLNERGIPSPRTARTKTLEENPDDVVTVWEPSTLRQLLLNPTIAGRRVYRGEDIGPAAWDPIVDYGEWLKLHALLTDKSRLTVPTPRGPAPRHMLSGIAKCGECGSRLKASTNQRRMKKAYLCEKEGCRKVSVTGVPVEELVEATILALFDSPGFRGSLVTAYQERESGEENGRNLAGEIAALEAERDELESYRQQKLITLRAYASEDKRIETELDELRRAEVAPIPSTKLRKMLSTESLRESWAAADLMDRREVIRILLDITINRPTRNTGRRFDPNRVVVAPSDFLRDDVLQGKPLGAKS